MLTKPVVFGRSVELACMALETEIPLDEPHSRSWSGGPFNALLCMNGVSADRSKYNEVKGKDISQYILRINNFSVADVDCEYKCVFGVDSTRTTLHLNERDYECKYYFCTKIILFYYYFLYHLLKSFVQLRENAS